MSQIDNNFLNLLLRLEQAETPTTLFLKSLIYLNPINMTISKHILFFNQISISDIGKVGGKNASLGEMYCRLNPIGIKIPNGFAVTAE